MDVSLRTITPANRAAVEALRVAPAQQNLVDGVTASLAEAAANPSARPWCRAVYAGDEPVGFVMLGDDVPAGHPLLPYRYYLWRMLIDRRHQGRGFGRAALGLVVEHLRGRPGADELVTSVVPGNGSPRGFYLRCGFVDTGAMFGHELVLTLPLAQSSAS